MPRRLLSLVSVALGLRILIWPAHAEDAPPTPAPAPAPDAKRESELARAEELDRNVEALYGQGRYAEATTRARESLAIREKALPPDHPAIATSVNNLAALLDAQGAYAEARPLYERALAIREKALGRDHPAVAGSLNNLADLLRAQGAYAEARVLHERALVIFERALGRDHPAVATSLNNLAEVLRAQGAYAEARPLHERALAIREQALGKDHPDTATSLSNLAALFKAQGAYAEARPRYEQALAALEKSLGKIHPLVAVGLNNLAMLLADQGAYADARALHERAIVISKTALGKDHPAVATSLNNLAEVLRAQGAYAEARPLQERALAIRELALGKDHPDVAASLDNLAVLLAIQGACAEAQPLSERALAIREKVLGRDHSAVASSLDILAELLRAQGAYADAKPLVERALAIRERALGQDHPDVATSLNNLARLLHDLGAYTQARPLYERALGILEKSFGSDHPFVAVNLNNLALLLADRGAHIEARLHCERSLAIFEKTLGKGHPDVATSLNNLAALLQARGAYLEARPIHERVLSIDEAHVRMQFAAVSSAERLALVRSIRHHLDNWLRFAPHAGLPGHAEALRFRGIVSRAEAAERALARSARDEQRATLAALQAATRLAARLANEPPGRPEARAAWQERYARAAAERERLTRELTSQVASARTALERMDLTERDVRNALNADVALVDLLRVGKRYVGWVLRASGEAARVELGAADAVDKACEAFVSAVADDAGDGPSRAAVAEAGADLRALVWAPLEGRLGEGVRRVVICPDATLASVPFAALPGQAPGTYLGDDLGLSFVFHPFDLVTRRDGPVRGVGAFVVGGVDYDHADAGSEEVSLPARPLVALDHAPRGGAFLPIPATRVEAEGLRERFGVSATTLLLGAYATEARLREGVKGKRFVHVATHGFARTDLLAGLHNRRIKDAFLSADVERQLSVGHDPMLLSGLALAGANPRDGANGDDGILTALEASYLDLEGVDLVTLSACETARGTTESGEGVQGLVAAFRMAGARRVIASLWRVDDEATRRLMEGVYQRILRGDSPLPPADALHEAALELRAWRDSSGRARFESPRYWAAFVAYGS